MSPKPQFDSEILPHVPMLRNIAYRYTHNQMEAEDLVQDVMLKACRNFDSFETGTNSRAWLCRIMSNTFINQYRKKKREHALMEEFTNETRTRPISEDLSKTLENSETHAHATFAFSDEILRAFNAVSKEFRSIVIMADVEELSYREIAEKLGIPIGTVMSRLARARQKLKEYLETYALSYGYGV